MHCMSSTCASRCRHHHSHTMVVAAGTRWSGVPTGMCRVPRGHVRHLATIASGWDDESGQRPSRSRSSSTERPQMHLGAATEPALLSDHRDAATVLLRWQCRARGTLMLLLLPPR